MYLDYAACTYITGQIPWWYKRVCLIWPRESKYKVPSQISALALRSGKKSMSTGRKLVSDLGVSGFILTKPHLRKSQSYFSIGIIEFCWRICGLCKDMWRTAYPWGRKACWSNREFISVYNLSRYSLNSTAFRTFLVFRLRILACLELILCRATSLILAPVLDAREWTF
jgi:hypothetical protein